MKNRFVYLTLQFLLNYVLSQIGFKNEVPALNRDLELKHTDYTFSSYSMKRDQILQNGWLISARRSLKGIHSALQ